MKVSFASTADIPVLTRLVNSAYRATEGLIGWTHEGHLLQGARADEALLLELVNANDSFLMLGRNDDDKLLASVHLKQQQEVMYFGMLAVDPQVQSKGVGNWMVQSAKDYAKARHCTYMKLTVLTQRIELINWYQRRGFTIESKMPFPDETRFGIPKQPLELLVMVCNLSVSPTTT